MSLSGSFERKGFYEIKKKSINSSKHFWITTTELFKSVWSSLWLWKARIIIKLDARSIRFRKIQELSIIRPTKSNTIGSHCPTPKSDNGYWSIHKLWRNLGNETKVEQVWQRSLVYLKIRQRTISIPQSPIRLTRLTHNSTTSNRMIKTVFMSSFFALSEI